MFQAILRTQWRATRGALLILAVVTAWAPFQTLRSPADAQGQYDVGYLMQHAQILGVLYQVIALILGLILATASWQPDRATRHVYALSLPVARSRYVILRMSSGLILQLPLVAVLIVSAAIACAQAPLPVFVQVFPVGVGIRFLLGSSLVFAAIFLLMTLSDRYARPLAAVLLTVVTVDVLLAAVGVTNEPWLLMQVGDALQSVFGPAGPYLQRWMLLDV